MCMHMYIHTYVQTYIQTDRQRQAETGRHADIHVDILTTDYRTYRQMICLKICSSDEALNPHPKP